MSATPGGWLAGVRKAVQIVGAVGILSLSLIGIVAFDRARTRDAVLETAGLAPLPRTASDFNIHAGGSASSASYLMRFEAPAAEIAAFIRDSEALRAVRAEHYHPGHMRLPEHLKHEIWWKHGRAAALQHDYYAYDSQHPWFDPTVMTRGRRYRIPSSTDHVAGEVIINDEYGVVYIHVSRG